MAVRAIQLQPLALETHTAITTAEAAGHLNRAQQTLSPWAIREDGSVRPLLLHGRLAWLVAELKRALGVAE